MNPQQNRQAVAEARAAVLRHCMCARFIETDHHVMAVYPPGFRLDGCRVSKGMGHAKALQTLLVKMEQHWKADQL